jgi:transporter family-2 protein
MKWILALAVLAVGMLQPVQAGMNAEFRRHAGHPLQAGGLNMVVGASAVVLLLLILRIGPPSRAAFAAAPWWSMLGGLIGATLVVTMLVAAPKLGAALLIAIFIAGQLGSSVVIDHFGLVGYPVRPVTPLRMLGLALLVAGALLVERSGNPDVVLPP